jgi:hypothetical protein
MGEHESQHDQYGVLHRPASSLKTAGIAAKISKLLNNWRASKCSTGSLTGMSNAASAVCGRAEAAAGQMKEKKTPPRIERGRRAKESRRPGRCFDYPD